MLQFSIQAIIDVHEPDGEEGGREGRGGGGGSNETIKQAPLREGGKGDAIVK